MTQLQQLQESIHSNAVQKGFWEEPVNIAEKLMLVVTEVAEMCEAHRKDKFCAGDQASILNDLYANGLITPEQFRTQFQSSVKDTFEDEMADAIIRLLDMAKKLNIDIDQHIIAKMRYNSMRPYKHGKAY